MEIKKISTIAIISFLFNPGITQSQSLDSALITGTYQAYVRIHRVMDTNYVRIQYLSDSSFAFTMTVDESDGSAKKNNILLQFNNASYSRGIARKVNYRGKPAWIGVIEDYQARFGKDTGYFNPDLVIADINKMVDTTLSGSVSEKKYDPYNNYDLIQFSFPSSGKSVDIRLVPSRLFGFADFFKKTMDSIYRKSDNRPMVFPPSYYAINGFTAMIKTKTIVRQLPAELSPANKKNASFLPGTMVYLSSPPYLKYVLVTQYGKGFHILKQGWIRMDAIENLRSTSRDKLHPPYKMLE